MVNGLNHLGELREGNLLARKIFPCHSNHFEPIRRPRKIFQIWPLHGESKSKLSWRKSGKGRANLQKQKHSPCQIDIYWNIRYKETLKNVNTSSGSSPGLKNLVGLFLYKRLTCNDGPNFFLSVGTIPMTFLKLRDGFFCFFSRQWKTFLFLIYILKPVWKWFNFAGLHNKISSRSSCVAAFREKTFSLQVEHVKHGWQWSAILQVEQI